MEKLTKEVAVGDRLKMRIPLYRGSFWTNTQRSGHSLHEIPYRACFKAQLPEFFINNHTKNGAKVLDPFSGRGTTLLQAALTGRNVVGRDINPLSIALLEPRLDPPQVCDIEKSLDELMKFRLPVMSGDDMLVFYSEEILSQLYGLREFFANHKLNRAEKWIRMVILSILSGHSTGHLSYYSLPPNSAATVSRQRKINEKYKDKKRNKNMKDLIIKKTKSLLRHVTESHRESLSGISVDLGVSDSRHLDIERESIDLVVTSPPFLDVIHYNSDNWIRHWFLGIDPPATTECRKVVDWNSFITETLVCLRDLLKPTGLIAFEVGEVKAKKINLEDEVIKCAVNADLVVKEILINDHSFTKTSNIWGVSNGDKGTNTNRIVCLRRR